MTMTDFTPPFVRRTLARMKQLAGLDPKAAADNAKLLGVSYFDVVEMHLWLERVARLMPMTPCEKCGQPINAKMVDVNTIEPLRRRPDARFCSAKCRQKAHRQRKASVTSNGLDASKGGEV
jgi:hypothetical protein